MKSILELRNVTCHCTIV